LKGKEEMKYVEMGPKGFNKVTVPLDEIKAMLEDEPSGQEWELELAEMTEEEYKKLPEFTGF